MLYLSPPWLPLRIDLQRVTQSKLIETQNKRIWNQANTSDILDGRERESLYKTKNLHSLIN